jgi:ferredoxin
MPRLTIDGREVEVPEKSTILTAAKKLGIHIPTMCFLEGYPYFTSCMICMVKETTRGKLLPACSSMVSDGMTIETDNDQIRQFRKDTVELLLSEHVGDCEGPCRTGCPAFMDIPLMIRQIAAGQLHDAIVTVKAHIPLPAVLGRTCPAPCENACRRGKHDQSVAICLLKRHVADIDLASDSTYLPQCAPHTNKKIAIAGAGPAGLTAAYYLAKAGHACTILDRNETPGGGLRTDVPHDQLPRDVLDAEINVIRNMGVEFRQGVQVGKDVTIETLRREYDAVILAVGTDSTSDTETFGVEIAKQAIKVDRKTFQTSMPGVFAAGAATGPVKLTIRAIADAHWAACAVDQWLSGREMLGRTKRFNSIMGKLLENESERFMENACDKPRLQPAGKDGFSIPEAVEESLRCMHCDCRKADSCTLRECADTCEAAQQHYRGIERKAFEQVRQHAQVIYEPGKCIKCGLCVRITENKEDLGLAFVGRGFDVRIGVPFNDSVSDALKETAKECVEACPTAALSFK